MYIVYVICILYIMYMYICVCVKCVAISVYCGSTMYIVHVHLCTMNLYIMYLVHVPVHIHMHCVYVYTGLQELDSLTDLDLTDNLLARHSDLKPLKNLHNLRLLSLTGESSVHQQLHVHVHCASEVHVYMHTCTLQIRCPFTVHTCI